MNWSCEQKNFFVIWESVVFPPKVLSGYLSISYKLQNVLDALKEETDLVHESNH